jgi:hypothetical protein
LRNIPKEKGKDISDDTLVFSNIVKEKDILKTSDCKVEYSERNVGEGFFGHLFDRGPKFVHFYFEKGNKYRMLILFIALLPIILGFGVLGIIFIPQVLYIAIGGFLLFSAFVFLKYKLDARDVFSIILYGPIVSLTFSFGICKGLVLKIFNKFD